jgi:sugar phosphate isomerase/epimerase
MKLVSRKKFLLSGLSLVALPSFFSQKKDTVPKLSFSTLGCPDWSFDKIIDFAKDNHYTGIEVRGILREMDLPKVPEFSNPESIALTLKKMNDRGLEFVDLGSSCALHFPKGEERTKNLNEGKRFIDLAEKLNCPYIRVFPNQLPKDRDRRKL